jgi:AraC-like DNA-binding protein
MSADEAPMTGKVVLPYTARAMGPRAPSPPRNAAAIAPSVVGAVASAIAELGYQAVAPSDPDALFDDAARELDEPLLGLRVAARVPVGAFGLLEYGMRASATVGDALQRLARHYAAVTTRVRTEVAVIEGRSALVFHRRAGVRHSRHWLEMSMCAIATRIAEGAGGAGLLYEVHFTHGEPRDGELHADYVQAFGAPVRFRAPDDALVFLDGVLARPLWTGSATVASSVDAALKPLVPEEVLDPLQVRVRAAIASRLSEGATLAAVARDLNLAPRTLQRFVAACGSSFARELDEVRRTRALAMLDSPDKRKMAYIATELGFADASAFFRAFRRWTGTTPGQHGS